jgi:putative transposase
MKTHQSTKLYPLISTPFFLKEGMLLEIGGTPLRLLQLLDGKAVIQNLDSGELKEALEGDLIDRLFEGEVTSPDAFLPSIPALEMLGDDALTRVQARGESDVAARVMYDKVRWVDALKQMGIDKIEDKPWVRTAIAQLSKGDLREAHAYRISTLVKVQRAMQRTQGDPLAVLPHFAARGGRGKNRLCSESEAIIQAVIEDEKIRTRKVVVTKILGEINERIKQLNLTQPEAATPLAAFSTISRRVKYGMSAFEICQRKYGKSGAEDLFRDNGYARDCAEHPLEIAESDDTDSRVFLISNRSGLPWGRAYLTPVIDQSTGVLLGSDLSHKYRSVDSALGAIQDCILPKDCSRQEFQGLKYPWLGYGFPGTILLDNARYNGALALQKQSERHRLILAKAKPYAPTEKRTVEYFNNVFKHTFCANLPGWIGEKNDGDSVKAGISSAVLTEEEFRLLFVRWVVGEYTNKPGDDGWSPGQRWTKFYDKFRPAVRWSRSQVSLLRLIPASTQLRESGGLMRNKLRYNSQQLQELRIRIGFKSDVNYFYDVRDLSYLVVASPFSDLLFRVPCVEKLGAFQGLTDYQHTLILKMCKQRGQKNPSMSQYIEAGLELCEMTKQLAFSKKLRSRREAEKIGVIQRSCNAEAGAEGTEHSNKPQSTKAKVATQIMTELEWEIGELAAVELDLEDPRWGQ